MYMTLSIFSQIISHYWVLSTIAQIESEQSFKNKLFSPLQKLELQYMNIVLSVFKNL